MKLLPYNITVQLLVFLIILTLYEADSYNAKQHKKGKSRHKLRHGKRQSNDPIVQTAHGSVLGKRGETRTGQTYYAFQGIPFAKPPVGNLRFEPPQRPNNWTGIYNATFERSICIQTDVFFSINQMNGTEDCLYINVYTPKLPEDETYRIPRPVLVWIYGGGFIGGNANYDSYPPDKFLSEGLVYVSFNYRLGIFGFISTGDRFAPGNIGLKDQVHALRWVQENIIHFGGDPRNVTIMGESAGGASVSYMVQSPRTAGLFKGAIMQSGTTLDSWALSRSIRLNVLLLGLKVGVFDQNTEEIVKRLKSLNANELRLVSTFTMQLLLFADPLNILIYAPVIEPESETAVFTAKSWEQLDSCNFTKVPIIIGFTSEEANSFSEIIGILRLYLLRYDLIPADLVPKDMNMSKLCNANEVGNDIKNYYVGRNGQFLTNSRGLVRFLSDNFFVRPIFKYAHLYSRCNVPTYFYKFAYTDDRNSTGAGHASELPYLFSNQELTREKEEISEALINYWVKFIIYGNPSAKLDGEDTPRPTWEPTSDENDNAYLELDREIRMVNQTFSSNKKDVDMWENLYERCGQRPFDTYKRSKVFKIPSKT